MHRIQRLFIIALFGAIIFVGNIFLPPPLNYLMMVVQSIILALASLFIHKVGAMYVGAIGGLLTAIASPSLGPFTFLFAFLYGAFVDVFMALFKVKGTREGVNRNRLMVVMMLSTLLIAVSSYSAFASSPTSLRHRGCHILVCFFREAPCLMRWCCLWVPQQVLRRLCFGLSLEQIPTTHGRLVTACKWL